MQSVTSLLKNQKNNCFTSYLSYAPIKGAWLLALYIVCIVCVLFLDKSSATPTATVVCDTHGGVDCSAGSDSDGSVICRDGYRKSKQKFLAWCSSARLISISGNGMTEKLVIRNRSDVIAKNISVTWRAAAWEERVTLVGPTSIEPYEVAEYTLPDKRLISPSGVIISCDNCEPRVE